MDLPITTPALLFPAIAILMLGYVNRYIGVANVVRSYKKDDDSNLRREDLIEQLAILAKRLETLKYMLMLAATALMTSCLSMLLIFTSKQNIGEIAFASSLLLMVISLFFSVYETSLSNTSLHMEIKNMLANHNDRTDKSA